MMPTGPEPEIVIDLSRLVSRIRHPTPTGVDRVELAYALGLDRLAPGRVAFGALHPVGRYGRIGRTSAMRFLHATEATWAGRSAPRLDARSLVRTLGGLLPRPIPARRGPRVLVQSSPHHLHRPATVRRILASEDARFVCLIHDLIPIEYPEYARPGGAVLHRRRIDTILSLADGIVTNSAATRDALVRAAPAGCDVPIEPALLGLDLLPLLPASQGTTLARPYFVVIGTIEPRKNHLLLLHIWRHLSTMLPPEAMPELLVIGRRGWENEQVIDLLDRCPALVGHVRELGRLSDGEVAGLLAGASALLLPSFAEGYGMPVPEAISIGIPVLCSDLPALREAGGDVPDYLDPLDGPGWIDAILAYAAPTSPRRDAQSRRAATWRAPSWDAHLATVLALADRIA